MRVLFNNTRDDLAVRNSDDRSVLLGLERPVLPSHRTASQLTMPLEPTPPSLALSVESTV